MKITIAKMQNHVRRGISNEIHIFEHRSLSHTLQFLVTLYHIIFFLALRAACKKRGHYVHMLANILLRNIMNCFLDFSRCVRPFQKKQLKNMNFRSGSGRVSRLFQRRPSLLFVKHLFQGYLRLAFSISTSATLFVPLSNFVTWYSSLYRSNFVTCFRKKF